MNEKETLNSEEKAFDRNRTLFLSTVSTHVRFTNAYLLAVAVSPTHRGIFFFTLRKFKYLA